MFEMINMLNNQTSQIYNSYISNPIQILTMGFILTSTEWHEWQLHIQDLYTEIS